MADPAWQESSEDLALNADDVENEDLDEWLFSSVKQYNCLHMFELQYPTRAMDWLGKDRVCVGCLQPDGSTELLELCLPDKLLAGRQQEGLARGRDFHFLSGGFHDQHVWRIKHLPGRRQIATSEIGSNHVSVWKLPDDTSDLLKCTSRLDNPAPDIHAAELCVQPSHDKRVAFGSKLNNICVADLTADVIEYQTHDLNRSDHIGGLHYLDENRILVCGQSSGDIWVLDVRQKVTEAQHFPGCSSDPNACWVTSLSNTGTSEKPALSQVAKLSTRGTLEMYDIQDLSKALHQVNIGLKDACLDKEGDLLGHSVQFSPHNSSVFSISGVDGNIYVYDTTRWAGMSARTTPSPVFTHQGHTICSPWPKECVTMAHLWHSTQTDVIMSAASDGSLHAWSYVT